MNPGMMTERARVVAVDEQGVWLETIQRSACNACSAQKGCGQSVLGKFFDGKRHHFQVALQQCNPELHGKLQIDDSVEIGFADQAVLKGSLMLYLLPMLSMLLAGIGLSESLKGVFNSDLLAIVGAAAGLVLGLAVVRWHNRYAGSAEQYQPQILRRLEKPGGSSETLHLI